MTRPKIPTRREIRATMLSAMATTLDNDANDLGAGYLYDCVDDMGDAAALAHRYRVQAVAAGLVAEFARRAEKLRR